MYTVSKLSSPEKAIVLFLQINTVLMLASGHFTFSKGHLLNVAPHDVT